MGGHPSIKLILSDIDGTLLPQVLAAGRVREMTLKEQNVDELIARMYNELAL